VSNILFPKIRGLAWDITKAPTFNTEIQESLAGREVRIQNFQNPIWEFTLHYEYLLNDPKVRDENEQTPLECHQYHFANHNYDDRMFSGKCATHKIWTR